jgi:hypothetical protein
MHFKEEGSGCGLNSFGSGKGTEAESCEHGNEPSRSILLRDWLFAFQKRLCSTKFRNWWDYEL